MYGKIEKKALEISAAILIFTFITSMISLYVILDTESHISFERSFQIKGQNKTIKNIIGYLKEEEDLNASNLNEKEISHMGDVREIVLIIKYAALFSFVSLIPVSLYLVKNKKKKMFFDILFLGSFIGLASMILLIIFLYNFPSFFSLFHSLLFEEGTWMFKEGSTLITLFPFDFFRAAFSKIIIMSSSLFLVFFAVSAYWKNLNKRRKRIKKHDKRRR